MSILKDLPAALEAKSLKPVPAYEKVLEGDYQATSFVRVVEESHYFGTKKQYRLVVESGREYQTLLLSSDQLDAALLLLTAVREAGKETK